MSDLSNLIPFQIIVDDETFREIEYILSHPTGPTETIKNGARLLRKLMAQKSPWDQTRIQ